MHAILGFFCLFLILFGGTLTLKGLESIRDWSQRRRIQFFILATPCLSFGLAIGSWYHFSHQAMTVDMPFWDVLLGVLLPPGIPLIALGAFVLGTLRILFMQLYGPRDCIEAPPPLQELAVMLAQRLQIAPAHVLVRVDDRPLAWTYGVIRPRIILSTWMLSHLDQQELEAVLAHELAHVARRDYLVMILATLLRDAFFYLPPSQIVYRQLRQEKELRCDDEVVRVTRRPLALASALTKAWLHALEASPTPPLGVAQSLFQGRISIQDRIERLLATDSKSTVSCSSHLPAKTTGRSLFTLLASLIIQGMNLLNIFVILAHHTLPFPGMPFYTVYLFHSLL